MKYFSVKRHNILGTIVVEGVVPERKGRGQPIQTHDSRDILDIKVQVTAELATG